jgi:broad specificity phosphatase PhoE
VTSLTILLRHGETAWNAERRFTTRSDIELNDAGIAQAEGAAAALAATAIDRVYASPLKRALRTAEIVVAAHPGSPPITVDGRLTEIDAGPFEGLTPEEVEAGPNAAAYRSWHTDGEPQFPDGAEPFDDALIRAAAFMDDHAGDDGTTLVVTHGSLARLIVSSHLLGARPALHRRLWMDNCAMAVIETRLGIPRLIGFNVRSV